MADWRQIQGRIRRAKTGADPPRKLTELFQKTRDGMVAFELGQLYEQSGQNEEAVRWYTSALERFRRTEWKKKAEEALARLGAPLPELPGEQRLAPPAITDAVNERLTLDEEVPVVAAEQPVPPSSSRRVEASETVVPAEQPKRRRRGRRGRRAHRRAVRGAPLGVPPETRPEAMTTPPAAEAQEEPAVREPVPPATPVTWQVRARAGEPALASRLARLEAQLRQLIASPLHGIEEAEHAPAGPGVYLLSDSDQTTYYYAEACRTLRIALANLARGQRGERGGRGEGSLRARLAEHLGISESRVSKYLKEHCAVRWLQLDEGASHLVHFAIAVLHPPLND